MAAEFHEADTLCAAQDFSAASAIYSKAFDLIMTRSAMQRDGPATICEHRLRRLPLPPPAAAAVYRRAAAFTAADCSCRCTAAAQLGPYVSQMSHRTAGYESCDEAGLLSACRLLYKRAGCCLFRGRDDDSILDSKAALEAMDALFDRDGWGADPMGAYGGGMQRQRASSGLEQS